MTVAGGIRALLLCVRLIAGLQLKLDTLQSYTADMTAVRVV